MSSKFQPTPSKGSKPIDLTPFAASNWIARGPSVLTVNPEATIHQRFALAWGMSQEIETISEAAMSASGDSRQAQALCEVLHEKAVLLQVLLYEMSCQTADQEVNGGGA